TIATVALASFCLLALPVLAQKSGNTGNITGLVKDAGGNPVAAATVTAGGKSTTTASNGSYTLNSVATGTQTVTASKSLYLSGSVQVNVPRRATITASTILLTPNWGSVSGTVTIAGTGTPIAGVTIAVAGTPLTTTTDASGNYTFAQVGAGSQTINASASGYQ